MFERILSGHQRQAVKSYLSHRLSNFAENSWGLLNLLFPFFMITSLRAVYDLSRVCHVSY